MGNWAQGAKSLKVAWRPPQLFYSGFSVELPLCSDCRRSPVALEHTLSARKRTYDSLGGRAARQPGDGLRMPTWNV